MASELTFQGSPASIDVCDKSKERSVDLQIQSLNEKEKEAFLELKEYWKTEKGQKYYVEYTDYQILRFVRNSPGKTKFNVKTAKKVAKNYAKWSKQIGLDDLTVNIVRKQLETECLSIPGTVSCDGHLFVFMRPAIFFPRKHSLNELMRSQIYLLERMTELEKCCTEGIAVMCNMENWTFSNFGLTYAKTYFDTMQGRFPMRIRMFLIVNPPSWFGKIWKIIRPMMSADFAAKVKLPKKEEIAQFVKNHEDLPTDFGGKIDIKKSLDYFIRKRYQAENLDLSAPYGDTAAPNITATKAES